MRSTFCKHPQFYSRKGFWNWVLWGIRSWLISFFGFWNARGIHKNSDKFRPLLGIHLMILKLIWDIFPAPPTSWFFPKFCRVVSEASPKCYNISICRVNIFVGMENRNQGRQNPVRREIIKLFKNIKNILYKLELSIANLKFSRFALVFHGL